MAKIQTLLKFIEGFFLSIWGFTLMDLLPMLPSTIFESVDEKIKTFMAAAGAIFLLLSLPFKIMKMVHEWKSNRIELRKKQEELEKLIRDNDNEDKNLQKDSGTT